MTTASSIDLLTGEEAQLLTSLVSAGSEKTLLRKALVTIGNKAASTSNQVIVTASATFMIITGGTVCCPVCLTATGLVNGIWVPSIFDPPHRIDIL